MTAPGVARVCVDSPLPHLDRLFDYAIPEKLAPVVGVGSRVRVRFAGRLVSAVVCEVADRSEYGGELSPLRSSAALPSYDVASLALARAVADRQGGGLWDVLRLMAPPRVASVEKRAWDADRPSNAERIEAALALLADVPRFPGGEDARLVWAATPAAGNAPPTPVRALLAVALREAARPGAGEGSAIIVVPDARAVAQVLAAAEGVGLARWSSRSSGDVAVVHSSDPPAARYGSYLAAMRGEARIVLGTRPALLAPVPRLAHLSLWDDAHSAYEERHAPYPRALAVAALRAEREHAGLLIAGFAPSVAARALVEHGWATAIETPRDEVRAATPATTVLAREDRDREGGSGWHWMPGRAWRAVRGALERGPALVLVPRSGYVRGVACAACREWAACRVCGGPLALASRSADPACLDCGTANADWHCPNCGGSRLAHARQGVERMAEQLAAMAPGVAVAASSSGTGILDDGAAPAGIVVATPGAIPAVDGGYAVAVLVDAGALVGPGIDGEQDAVRQILAGAAHVRPRGDGGEVIVVGRLPDPVAKCAATWTADAWAADAYAERAALGLPPARRVVAVAGTTAALDAAREAPVEGRALAGHPDVRVVPADDGLSLLVTRRVAQSVVDALRALQVERSRAGEGDLHLRVDGPFEPGG